ncbi:MAG: LVIVD repeat-containing protein [Saprospiraceae bacterium]
MKYALLFSTSLVLFFSASCTKDAASEWAESGKSGSITRFTIHQGYLYALNPNEVLTYSLANPDKPELVHRLPTDYGLETIIVYDQTIYLGSRSALYILGISDPAAPVILSRTPREIAFFGGCDPVVVKENYAYSTIKIIENRCGNPNSQSALLVYDVREKNNPENVGVYFLNEPNGLGYKDNLLFICDEGADQIVAFDISNPLELQSANISLPLEDPLDLIIDGNKMIVSARTEFQIYDLSDLSQIRQIGKIRK